MTQPDSPFIRVDHLTHVFPGRPEPITALQDISLDLNAGDYVAIVGANGSGKSTLARHFNALLRPTNGDVWVKGANTRDSSQLRDIRRNVAMVFQNPENQFVATVVEEDVAFGPENFGVPLAELRERVHAALEVVDLQALKHRAPHELSAGQQQRLAIAGALAIDPAGLVLDEATSMLDPRGQQAVLELASALHAKGLFLAWITQSMEEAAQAKRVIALGHGKIAAAGTPREIFAAADRLRGLDLELPPFSEIACQLHTQFPDFPTNILTFDELVDELAPRLHNLAGAGPISSPSLSPAPLGAPIIQTEALRHTFLRGTPRAVEALRGVDLSVFTGEIVGIIGATGSGKSTLLQHLNGLLRPRPDEGRVMVDGIDISDPQADLRRLRQRVGLVFQFAERQLFERYVGDDIAYGPRQFGYDSQEVRRRVQRAMAQVGLDFQGFKDRLTLTLSSGEKRRAALAGVLALEPRVLILDEPTAGLDPRGRRELLESLKHWRAESSLTIVLVSHHMNEIAEVCDRVYVLEAGRVAFTGSPRELFEMSEDASGASTLARLGLVSPPAVRVAGALRRRGIEITHDAITIDELVAELSRRMKG